ncbi:MAG: hypothetical protein MUF29_01195, partial [Chitinophagaceae bacterium]|nr:hypothetical protein [Chitinophagaceae bacterium]
MRIGFFILFSLLLLLAQGQPAGSGTDPIPVQELNRHRGDIVLNGWWEFQPDTAGWMDPALPLKGRIMQPGSWLAPAWWANIPGVADTARVFPGVDWQQVKQAWYRKMITVPDAWKGRTVELDFSLVSTNAIVFIDGKLAGQIAWGGGTLDITRLVRFGQRQVVQVLVYAGTDEKQVPVFMGTATEQVSLAPASLASAGIVGDVVLRSRPGGASLEDVFVKTSFRQKAATLEVTVCGVQQAAKVRWHALLYNGNTLEKEVYFDEPVAKADTQKITLSFPWPDARLWDLDKPELYTLVLEAKGGTLADAYTQTFGFREFWIAGKDFLLNGKKIRLRPFETVNGGGMDEAIDAQLKAIRKAGFNFMELWPENEAQRGYYNYYDRVAERADRQGFLISGVLQSLNRFITGPGWVYQWDKPEVRAAWERWLARQMKRDRNHPSIIMWGTSANFFGSAYDQYPRNLGKSNWNEDNAFWVKNRDAALQAFEWVRANWDNTRPIFTHHGAYVGDLHTVNMYLNLLPLQEREEWLSEYAEKGTMPFMPIEFGTPFENTFLRGRNGFAKSVV